MTLLAKNQVPICLLSLSKFNIEYIAEISKKAITQQKNENSKNLRDPFSYFHLRNAEPKFQGSRLNGVAWGVGDTQTDRQID